MDFLRMVCRRHEFNDKVQLHNQTPLLASLLQEKVVNDRLSVVPYIDNLWP